MKIAADAYSPSPEEIRALMASRGWSGYEAAKLCGVTQSAISQALAGTVRMRPTTWMLMKLKAEAAPVVSVRSKKRSETAGAKSMRKFRSKGKFISLTLVDPEAVEILERLHAKHGSIRAAIEAALISAESRK